MGKLFRAVAYVTIFSVLTRALGFLLRIYLSRAMGAELLGSYQIAMSIFSVILTLVASGLPTIVSRRVAYYRGNNELEKEQKTVSAGLIIALVVSTLVCLVFVLFPSIFSRFSTYTESLDVLMFLLPGAIISAIYAILRGALWGQKRFFTISFAEFFEQVIRIAVLFIILNLPLSISISQKAGLSLTIACVVSTLYVVIMYFVFGGHLKSPKGEFKSVLKTSSPITAVRTISSLVTSLIAIIIPARLMLYGYTSSEALAKFGTIMGMTFPLIMVPGTLISSFAVAIIPDISEQTTNIDIGVKDFQTLKSKVNLSISLTIIISCLLLPAYLSVGRGIGYFLFASYEAGEYLSKACVLMLTLGTSQITSSILNAIGLELKSLKNYAISAVALFVCIFFLPKYLGVDALILGMFLLSTISTLLNLLMLKKRNLLSKDFLKVCAVMLISTLPCALLGYFTFNIVSNVIPLFFALAISGGLSTGFLILLILCSNLGSARYFLVKKLKKKPL
ncbi:MAG: oligosaccharide flippase family protein [Clostridia bacterium]|nr:oligosaccharide flippase family protein [Clostridia bacterium]